MINYLTKYKARFGLIVTAIVCRQLLLVGAQQLNASVFNQLADKQTQQFFVVLFSMLGVWAIIIGLDALLYVKEEKIMLDMQQTIREDVSAKMVASSFGEIQSKTTGNYLSWLNNDVTVISQKGMKQVFNIVRGISGVVFAGILMIQYHWSLLIATGIGFVCMFYLPQLFDKRVYEVSEEVSQGNEQFVSELEDQLNGYTTYFAFSSLRHFIKRIQLASTLLKRVMMKQIKLDAAVIAVNFSINVFFQVLLTFIAAICYFNGWIPIGVVAIVGSLADIMFSGLGDISYQLTSLKSVKPIFDKYDTLQAEQVVSHELSEEVLYTVNQMGLRYGEDSVFDNLTFSVSPSHKCLISGVSGSGKSSLVKLLLGYNKDFTGDIQYKGQDIREVSSKTIAQEVLYLSQQTHVFHGTIRENIQLGSQFTDDDMLKILSVVGLGDSLATLELEATELSGGQKQRLALARALIRNPKVIICDEITSALDRESSRHIEDILLSQQQLTVIMITHVLQSDIRQFDMVVEL